MKYRWICQLLIFKELLATHWKSYLPTFSPLMNVPLLEVSSRNVCTPVEVFCWKKYQIQLCQNSCLIGILKYNSKTILALPSCCYFYISRNQTISAFQKTSAAIRVGKIGLAVLGHLWFNSYTPELVPVFYSAIKQGYRGFISEIKSLSFK